jgi:hypothetical protein
VRGTRKGIEEGRGQSINFRLLKFSPGCVQLHSFKFDTLPYSVWRGRGVLGCVGDHRVYCRTFTLYMGPDSDSTKLLDHPMKKTKTLERMGHQTNKH